MTPSHELKSLESHGPSDSQEAVSGAREGLGSDCLSEHGGERAGMAQKYQNPSRGRGMQTVEYLGVPDFVPASAENIC